MGAPGPDAAANGKQRVLRDGGQSASSRPAKRGDATHASDDRPYEKGCRGMPIDMKTWRVRFGPEEPGWQSGQAQSREIGFGFPTRIKRYPEEDEREGEPIAQSFINGFNIGFTGTDHEIFRQEINLSPPRILSGDQAVEVTAYFALRDDSGTFDDDYNGFIDVGVIVDRE